MKTGIMPLMAYPAIIVSVNVRGFRMACLIAESWMLRLTLCWMRSGMRRSMRRRWAMGWNVTSTDPMFYAALRRLRMWLWSMLLRSVLLIAMFLGQSNRASQEKYAE